MNSGSGTNRATGRSSARLWSAILIAAASSFAALPSQATAGGLMQETVTASQQIEDPSFGSEVSVPLSIARFDTMGGTRELLGISAEYFIGDDFTYTIDDNATAEAVGAEATWEEFWSGSFNGATVFPTGDPPNDRIGVGSGFGYVLGPFETGETFSFVGGGGTSFEVISDAATLNMLTGTEPFAFDSNFTLSDIAISDPDIKGFPHNFAPDSLHIAVDALNVNVSLTYNYTIVPEPASLCLLGFGALVFTRRRR